MTSIITDINKGLGKRVRQLRFKESFSTKEVADYLDISEEHLRLYEEGIKKIEAEVLVKLSHLFCIPMSSFFDFSRITDPEESGTNDKTLCFVNFN
ncbi:MAG: helix-turn-helix transcriptional regulator, partial [Alphaproteobacteria bacterium]|nr:helix-turn-helix transcriptional regulator [Alphaproteobacteria bacterium]